VIVPTVSKDIEYITISATLVFNVTIGITDVGKQGLGLDRYGRHAADHLLVIVDHRR